MKQKFLTKAIMATLLGGMMFAPNLALAVNYNWDMQNMVKLGTSTSIVAKQATSGQSLNVYLNSTTGHYTLNAKMCSTNKFILYYGYDKETGEVLGNAIAPIQAKGSTTNKPQFVFTLKASDLPENYTAEQLDGIFKKLLEKYVDVYDTSKNFYSNCSLQVVDDSGNPLYEGKFDTVNKIPNYLAISGKTLTETNMQTIGSTTDKAFIVGTAADQNEIALGKSDVVVSSTTFKFPTANTDDETLYGIYNDQAGKILASGGKFTLNAGNNAAPDKSIGIYAGNTSSTVGEVKLNFDDAVSITAGLHALEAGKNGKITVSGAEAGTAGMTVQTIKEGYAAYAHDGGEVNIVYGGSSQLNLNHTSANNTPANGAILYAENGGVINADNQAAGKIMVTVGGLSGTIGKALTDDTGIINLKMTGGSGTLKVNAEGNVNIVLAGGNIWEGNAAGNTTLTAGNKSMWEYSSAEAQHLKSFAGTNSEGNNSFVTMAGGNITIDTYSGNGLFLFTNSSNTISGGNITVTSAISTAAGGEANPLLNNITKDTLYFDSANDGVKEISAGYENISSSSGTSNSVITLATTTTLTDNTEIKNLLTQMANKLVYTGIQNSEKNLDAVVAVVDNLATNGNILKYANVTFNNDGSKVVGELQTPVAAGGLHVQIFGEEPSGSVYDAYVTKDAQQNNVYTFNKDIIINRYAKTQIDGKSQAEVNCQFWSPIFGAFKADENPATVSQSPWNAGELNYTVDMQNHKLTAKNHYETGRVQAIDRSAIINLNREGSITFNNVAGMDLQATADMYYTSAIIVQEYSPNNALTKGAHITINNSAGWDNAVKATSYLSGGDAAYAMNNYIIFADGRNVPKDTATGMLSIDIANLVDVDATKGQFGVTAWGWGSEISVGGGKILSNGGMPAISTTGNAVVNFNVTKDNNGVVVGAGSNPVMIDGVVKTGTPFYGSGGTINIGLNTSDSYVKGTIIAEGEPNPNAQGYMAMGYGYTNIWMGNGAKWINTGVSKVTNLRADNKVNVLDMTTNGVGSVTIDNYSGNLVAIYKHNHDGDEATDYAAGDIKIKSSAEGSVITLVTDNSGIDTTSNSAIEAALGQLAKKVYYLNASTESNLTGNVGIAEGLTAKSAMIRLVKNLRWQADGQGRLPNRPDTETGSYTDPITGNYAVDKYTFAASVLPENSSTYTFSKDTTVKVTTDQAFEGGPWYGNTVASVDASSVNKNVTIDMQGHSLNVTTQKDGSKSVLGMTATGTATSQGKIEINNAGSISVIAKHDGTSYGTALFVNGGGEIIVHNGGVDLENKVLTLRAGNTTQKGKGSAIKTMNGASGVRSKVIVDGLIDIVAKNDGSDGMYSDEAISVVASTVSIGGGTVKAIDGCTWAIRSYGEFATQNTGTVYINANHTDGNSQVYYDKVATGAGTNRVVLEGKVGMSGSMNVFGSINVGFGTSDSYYKGDIASAAGWGAATGYGSVNMWFTPGSYWTGNDLTTGGDTNIYLDGATWTGYSSHKTKTETKSGSTIVSGMNLSMKNASTWNNKGTSTLESLTADTTANSIFMTDAAAKDVTIDSYAGNTKVFYAHTEDGTSATHYAAGNLTVKEATAGSVITLVTDNAGMDMTKNNKVMFALNALSGKLYYLAAKDGKTDLSGVAMIAEGLTSASVAKKTANISFYDDDGQGYIYGADNRYTVPITGDITKDNAYVNAGVLSGNTYTFDGDAKISVTNSAGDAGAVMAEKSLTIAASGKKVSLTGAGKNNSYGIKTVGSDAANALQVTVNAAETEIVAKDGGSSNIGMYVSGNADVTVNGKLTMHTADGYAVNTAANGYDYYGASAIYAANIYGDMQKGGKITVTDAVDLLVDANGVFVNGGAGAVTLAGGSIEVNKDNTKHYAALRAENGTINMNVNDGATTATNNDVNIKGNVSATCGAVYYTDPGTQTTINLGLNTGTSTWIGVAYNAFPAAGVVSGSVTFKGDINLWLANGATWTNEQYGAVETPSDLYLSGNAFNGSNVSKFVGGSTADTKGYIFQKDTNPLVIDNYSGNTKVFYEHNDSLAYQGGYIRIVSAAADSVITLATDNTGIDMTKTSVVNAALNSLANKLYYTAFIAGEKNLTGNVEILEGLTASSATLKSGEITFDGAGGQGTYQGDTVTPGEDPDPTVSSNDALTGTMADNSFMGSKVTNVEGTVIYDLSAETYSFRQMNVAADAKAVLNVGEGAVYFDGKNNSNYGMILNDGANVTINGNVNTSSYSPSYAAAGISMMIGGTGVGKQSNLIINGRVTMGSEDEYGVVAEDKHGAYSTYKGTRWTGAGINMNQGHGSKITITKGLSMYVDGHGIVTDPYYADNSYADKDLAVVNVNGVTNIHVESGEDVGLYAFANFGGTININMKDGEPGKDKVTVYGNAIVMKDTLGKDDNPYFYRSGEINLALTTADSSWTGAVDNTGTNQAGDFNLYLQNGGTWDYQNASKMDGLSAATMPSPSLSYYGTYDGISHVANLVGGDSIGARGVIQVNNNDTIQVGNYSGNVIAIYEHDADNPTDINGGDIKIANAKVGSIITLSTDNAGVTSDNSIAVLNALAGKLYYTADNKNLTGYVQIAEGLTAASVALYTGNIAFDSASGQGSYTKEESGTIVPGGIGGDGDEKLKPVEDADSKTYNIEESKAIVVATGSALTTPENGKATIINNADTLILSSADPSSPVVDATNGNVSISGTTEITGLPGQTLLNVAKELKLEGVKLIASGDGKVVEMTPGSKVSIGAEVDEDGKIVASGKDVVVVGDVQNTQGTFNMALATANSSWTGNYKNEDAVLNLLIDNLDAKWTGSVNGDVLNLNINRGTWINTGASSSTSGNFNLTAGGTKVAFLDMRNVASDDVTVDKFSGGMTIMYRKDENNPTDIGGGDVTIKSAAENSVINLWTDGKGLDLSTEVGDNATNDAAVKAVLNALAAKLTYTNFATEGNITGSVGVGEGLTRPAASLPKAAELVFAAADAGKGSINESTFKDNIPHGEIVYGDSETAMMRGAKMAMASTAMIWRAENNDLMKRMGDLRLRTEDSGVWAKYYSGKNEYDNNGSFNNKYKAVQVGVDTKLGNGWLGGVAFSYDNGRSNYSNGGNGDNKVKSLAAYATKLSKDGQYVDLIAKVSHLSNEYTVYNDSGYSLNGDYKNFGMSLSAEYGKKFDLKDGFYITPAAELTVGRINSKSYDAYSAYYNKNLHVEQDAFNSAVGRLSVAVGKKNDRATYYAKVGLAHEFAGGFDTTYSAPNEPTSGTSINFKDTWMELQLGGSVKLKNDATIYGTFGKTLGGEVKEKWRVDVGMLFTFNHISEFFGGKKKAQVGAVAATAPAASAANLTEGAASVEEKVYTTETAAVADAKGDRSASVKVGDTEVGATMPAPKVSKGAFMLDEYVVTASRTKQRITDATADISVVTRKEIEEMHMETVEEALRTVPGVQFNNYGGGNQINANISGLRINGSKDIAILVDGVKINAFQGVDASGYMYSSVLNNMNNIERIEVLRGAAGVLYGSNAKGGVINIITREVEENKTILGGSIGSFNRRDYKINTMGKVGKMSYNLYQGTFHQGDVTDGNGDKWEGFTDTVNFGGKFAYKFDDKSKLTLDYSKIKSNFGGTDLIYNNFYNGKYDSEMLSVRHDWTIDKHWDNTFVYRKTDEKRMHKQEYFVGNVLKNTDTDYTYQFITDQVHFKNKYNDLVFGFEYTKAEDNITSGAKSDYTAHDIKNRAFFINEDLKIMKGVTLSGGIRNEKPDGFDLGSYTTKSYKLAWDPTKKDTIYAGRSEFFILPSMDQLFNKSWGNADLKPAQGRTESIGYNRKFDQNNFMTVNWFQTKEDTGYGYDDTKGKYVNTENGISRGWNAQYTCKLSDKWNFNLGWTHLYTYASGYDSYSFGYYPKDYATFGFNYECGKFSGGLNGFYYFRAKDDQNRRIFPADNYGVFNLSFNYKPTKGFKTYLKIDNIFNKFYAEHTDAGNDPYLTGTGSRKYYAMPGRAFMIGMEFTF